MLTLSFPTKTTVCQGHRYLPGIAVISICFICFFVTPSQGETRHHEAHEHGVGRLDVVLQGKDLHLGWSSPGANIFGFEHAPQDDGERQKVESAIQLLKEGEKLFGLPVDAGCRLAEVTVHSEIAEHRDSSTAEHHHALEESAHSEVEAKYLFTCSNPERVISLDVKLFVLFPGNEEIEVQLVTPKGQTAVELTPQNNRLTF